MLRRIAAQSNFTLKTESFAAACREVRLSTLNIWFRSRLIQRFSVYGVPGSRAEGEPRRRRQPQNGFNMEARQSPRRSGVDESELVRCLFDDSSDAILIVDSRFSQVIDSNRAARRVTGLAREQSGVSRCAKFFPAKRRGGWNGLWQRERQLIWKSSTEDG